MRPTIHAVLLRGALMAFPISGKTLTTPALIVAGALLIAASPPQALEPDAPEVVPVCAPSEALAAPAGAVEAAPDAAQQVLVAHLSRRFMIAAAATERMVAAAYRAAREVGLDPLLVL